MTDTAIMPPPTDSIRHKHGLIAKTMHWGFVAVFAYAIAKQLDAVSQLADPALLRFEIVFATAFLILLGVRFFYMRAVGATALPDSTPKLLKQAAHLGHLAIYGAVGMIALSGLGIGGLYALGITAGPLMGLVIGLHEVSVTVSYILIAGHVLAALFHRFKGDGVWSSMVPVWRERPKG